MDMGEDVKKKSVRKQNIFCDKGLLSRVRAHKPKACLIKCAKAKEKKQSCITHLHALSLSHLLSIHSLLCRRKKEKKIAHECPKKRERKHKKCRKSKRRQQKKKKDAYFFWIGKDNKDNTHTHKYTRARQTISRTKGRGRRENKTFFLSFLLFSHSLCCHTLHTLSKI